jgi:plasmid stabilization system protein ParE
VSGQIDLNPLFRADVARLTIYYVEEANLQIALRFIQSLERSMDVLSRVPEIGSRRKFRDRSLRDLRSFRVKPPFSRILIFYRIKPERLEFFRLMHGARDLPERLLENELLNH